MRTDSLSPTQLLKEITAWEQIAQAQEEPKRWKVESEGTVSVVSKTSSWMSSESDFSTVLKAMDKRISLLSENRFIHLIENAKTAQKWQKKLAGLKEIIQQKVKKYRQRAGIINTLYRKIVESFITKISFEESVESVLKRIENLYKRCSEGLPKQQEPFSQDRDFQIYALPLHKDLRPVLVEKIKEAKKSITIFTYSLNDPQVVQALEERAKNGVKVKIIGQKDTLQYLKKKLDPSIEFHIANPKGLMHLKIVVIDGNEVVYGSANLTTGGLSKDKTLMTAVKSDKLAQHILSSADEVIQKKTTLLDGVKVTLKNGQKLNFSFTPGNAEVKEKLIKLIESAKKRIDVAMYTWTHQELADKIIEKHKEGVQVTAIIDGGQGGETGTGHKVTKKLIDAKVPVILTTPNKFELMHYKYHALMTL